MDEQMIKENLFKDKHIAVIGSSGELEINDYSNLLKDVEVVVRVNVKTLDGGLHLPTKLVKNTHSRTDVLYHHGSVLGEKIVGDNKMLTINENQCISKESMSIFEKNGIKLVVIPVPWRFEQCKKYQTSSVKIVPLTEPRLDENNPVKHGPKPSTSGITTIYDILQYSPTHLYVVGFDCHLSPMGNWWYDEYVKVGGDTQEDVGSHGNHNMLNDLKTLYNIYKKYPNIIVTDHLKETWKFNNII